MALRVARGCQKPLRAQPTSSRARDWQIRSSTLADSTYAYGWGLRQRRCTLRSSMMAAVGSADELIDAVERLRPEAVLTDIRMPPGHRTEGIEAAHAIRASHPQVGVVVLSQHADEAYAFQLFRHGTAGLAYLLKERV